MNRGVWLVVTMGGLAPASATAQDCVDAWLCAEGCDAEDCFFDCVDRRVEAEADFVICGLDADCTELECVVGACLAESLACGIDVLAFAEPCPDDMDSAGYCEDDVLVFCLEDALLEVDCADIENHVCAEIPFEGASDCIDEEALAALIEAEEAQQPEDAEGEPAVEESDAQGPAAGGESAVIRQPNNGCSTGAKPPFALGLLGGLVLAAFGVCGPVRGARRRGRR